MIQLIAPTLADKEAVMAYRNEFLRSGESPHGSSSLQDFTDYEEWLQKVNRDRSLETLPEGRVQSDLYLARMPGSDKVLGMLQLRHVLNAMLLRIGGHIGYSVAPSERRKGYATAMLTQALENCKKLGIEKVLVTCHKDNLASAGVIKTCGGVYENDSTDDDGRVLQRYWISTAEL